MNKIEQRRINYKYFLDWRRRAKQRAVEAFGGRCGICGYDKFTTSLEFHHIRPIDKSFNVGTNMAKNSWTRLVQELKKCACICANCHRAIHSGDLRMPKKIRRFDRKFTMIRDEVPLATLYDRCPVCRRLKLKTRKYCSIKCWGRHNRKITCTRHNFLRRIKSSKPISTIARDLGVTLNSIKRRMAVYGIYPRPFERKIVRAKPATYKN